MKYIEVGKIVGTHGIKGEVKIKSDTSFKQERYKKGNVLYLNFENKYIPIKINSFRVHKGMDLITFNDYKNINDILKFVGSVVYVDKDDLEELEEDDFYYDELIGLEVYDEKDSYIGVLSDILEVPQGEILIIRTDKDKEIMVPFVDEYVTLINVEENKLIVSTVEGLI